jgi:hypothetical protein
MRLRGAEMIEHRDVAAAADYVARALRGGYRPGRGDVSVLDHFGAA